MKRVIIGILFILIGGGIISWSSRSPSRMRNEWTTGSATVLSSQLVGDTTRMSDGTTRVVHQADIHYRFIVNGATYESNVFSMGKPKSFPDKRKAEEILAAHPVGSEVNVYYDPANPARSALEQGTPAPQELGLMTLTSGMFLLIGLMLFISGALGWARSELVGQ